MLPWPWGATEAPGPSVTSGACHWDSLEVHEDRQCRVSQGLSGVSVNEWTESPQCKRQCKLCQLTPNRDPTQGLTANLAGNQVKSNNKKRAAPPFLACRSLSIHKTLAPSSKYYENVPVAPWISIPLWPRLSGLLIELSNSWKLSSIWLLSVPYCVLFPSFLPWK